MSKEADLKFGISSEKASRRRISKHLGYKLKHVKRAMSTYDFISRKERVYVELKTRRVGSERYKDLMIGHNKIRKAFNLWETERISVFICWRFLTDDEDTILIYKVSKDNFDDNWVKKKHLARWDRGRDEHSDLVFIPRDRCEKID